MEYFNTFGGNAAACEAGIAVLDVRGVRAARVPLVLRVHLRVHAVVVCVSCCACSWKCATWAVSRAACCSSNAFCYTGTCAQVLRDEALQGNALAVGGAMLRGLADAAVRHACVGDVRGAGLFIGVELVADASRSPDAGLAAAIVDECARRGVLLSTDGPRHNVRRSAPARGCCSDAHVRVRACAR